MPSARPIMLTSVNAVAQQTRASNFSREASLPHCLVHQPYTLVCRSFLGLEPGEALRLDGLLGCPGARRRLGLAIGSRPAFTSPGAFSPDSRRGRRGGADPTPVPACPRRNR